MSIIYAIAMIILLFGATIFVHELGHFLAARWMGLVIDAFSIGMGPALWKKEHKGITYKIGCLPIGGYVALPQLDPELGTQEEDDDDKKPKRELPPVSPWRKIPVQVSGVLFNLIFAFLLAVIIHAASTGPEYIGDGAVLGYVATDSPAYQEGLRMGDRITHVNGKEVSSWDEFVIESALSQSVELRAVDVDGDEKNIAMETEAVPRGGRMIRGIAKSTPCMVVSVQKGGSADRAGIQQSDVITMIDGIPVMGVEHLIGLVDEYAGQTVSMRIMRQGEPIELEVTPEYDEQHERALIGVRFNPFDINRRPLEQIKGWGMPVFRILRALITPAEARTAASSLGGPVSIFAMFWWAVQSSFLLALWFTGFINVNLAILNILPIPILDGGHLVFSVTEIITGKKMNARVLMAVYKLFIVLLVTAFVLITCNDVLRMVDPPVPTSEEDVEDDEIHEGAPEAPISEL